MTELGPTGAAQPAAPSSIEVLAAGDRREFRPLRRVSVRLPGHASREALLAALREQAGHCGADALVDPSYRISHRDNESSATALAAVLSAPAPPAARPLPPAPAVETRSARASAPARGATPAVPAGEPENDLFYALLIAVQHYDDPAIQALDAPLRDARRLSALLVERYGFDESNIVLLSDPTRAELMRTFETLSRRVTEADNLLIFYAGHGYWDERFEQGYWLPRDARKRDRSQWLSNSTLRDFTRGIRSRHTLLIADACFSGGIFKTRRAFGSQDGSVDTLYGLPSRKAMTSGTLNETPDKSVFFRYLVKRLETNRQRYLPAQALFVSFRQAVINNSPIQQVPQYGEIRGAGDEGGDFIFVHRP